MLSYSFYVGSTDTHDAHTQSWEITDAHPLPTRGSVPTLTHGIWGGVTENVAIYTVELATDIQAQRLAFALTVLTGNDAILVVREALDRDDHARTFRSTAAYRVDRRTTYSGNRTLVSEYGAEGGYRYTPATLGMYVAYLVGLGNTVSPVQ